MAQPSSVYEPRDSTSNVLYGIVRDHLETFRAHAASLRDGEGLPRFVEQEFRDFLRCGWLAAGFARFRCTACGLDRLVAFSCQGRGFCPRCGGRRTPTPTRTICALGAPGWRSGRRISSITCLRARRDGVLDGRSGAVATVQRFGGALNLNVHLHALVLDGVFVLAEGIVQFYRVRRLTREDVAAVVALIARRVERLLERRGLAGGADTSGAPDLWSEEAPVLAAAAAASVEGRVALGPRARARVRRSGDPPEEVAPMTLGPCHAHVAGFDLHAGLVTRAGERDRLERLCRYALRPPLAQDRRPVDAANVCARCPGVSALRRAVAPRGAD